MAEAYLNLIFHIIVAGVCASTFWKAANLETDGSSPLIWSLASLATFLTGWLVLSWSWPMLIAAQVALGLAIALLRTFRYLRKAGRG